MKTCYHCNGKVSKRIDTIELEGVSISDIPFEECEQCHERYFDEKAATILQKIVQFVKEQRKILLEEAMV